MRVSKFMSGWMFTATALTPAVAFAQTAPAPVPVAASTPAADPVAAAASGEIIVTAQRRAESITKVPISITSVSAATLSKDQVNTTLDLPRLTPGLQVSHNGLDTQPGIRGISTRVGENSVALYIDGVYNPSIVSAASDLTDVERVDVLKGPQGTLFGRNATGGAIMVKTLDPGNTFAFHMSAGAEERNGYRGSAYVNVPVTDTLSFNLSTAYSKSDGWLRQGVNSIAGYPQSLPVGTPLNPNEHSDERLKIKWAPTSDFTAVATLEHGHMADPGALAWKAISNTLFGDVSGLGKYQALNGFVPQSSATWNAASLKLSYKAGDWTFNSLTAYRREINPVLADATQNTGPQIVANWYETQRSLSEELNAVGKIGPVDMTYGVFLYDENLRKDYISAQDTADQIARSVAPFADLTWHATSALSITGGLRYTYEQRKFNYVSSTTPMFNESKSFNNVSPRAVVKYDLDAHSNVYLSYSQGFKSGLYNVDATGLAGPNDLAAQPLKSEKLIAWELGYKYGSGPITFSVAAYHYDWSNIQVNLYTNGNTIYENAASARIYGAEAALAARITPDFSVNVNGAWTHGRYTNFPDSAAIITTSSLPGNLQLTSDKTSPLAVAVSQNVTGQQLPRAPDFTFNVGFDYTLPTSVGKFEIVPNLSYTSRMTPDDLLLGTGGKNILTVAPHSVTSLTLNYEPSDRFQIAVYARNLFNKYYFEDYDFNGLGVFALPVEPRTVGIKFSYKY